MGLLGTLLRTTIHTVTLPVDLVKDVATFGNGKLDWTRPERPSFTTQKIRKLKRDAKDIEDDVDDL